MSGSPIQFELPEGQRHDYLRAKNADERRDVRGANVFAGRRYDGDSLLESLAAQDRVATLLRSRRNGVRQRTRPC